jgi:hypothetical protein
MANITEVHPCFPALRTEIYRLSLSHCSQRPLQLGEGLERSKDKGTEDG